MKTSVGAKLIRRLHMGIRSRIGHTMVGSVVLSQFSLWKNVRVNKNTICCIEGYPRCANTFAIVAFASAQPSKIKLAHHSHLAGQVLIAANRNLPILLLVRKPQDAIASLMIRDPYTSPTMMLKDYERFHNALLPVIDKLLVADFEQVVEDYGLVIQRLNQKFNTSFVAFEHTSSNVAACMEKIEDIDCRYGDREVASESQVSRPSENRKRLAAQCKAELSRKRYKTVLNNCETLYRVFYDQS